MTDTAQLDQLAINTIRTLSMDAVQAARRQLERTNDGLKHWHRLPDSAALM